MANIHTILGTKFGTFTVIRRTKNERGNRARFICLCDCGKEYIKFADELFTERYSKCECESKQSQEAKATDIIENAVTEVSVQPVNPIADIIAAVDVDTATASEAVENAAAEVSVEPVNPIADAVAAADVDTKK
ncbi:hypothetical protein [Pelosinus propionicus]|uniref:AP2 domain-containing protein n=1 Tax=Pelosinus propionicus DSM 13327 TaxID=1123291 RepID=A0A1I4N109_9FIRM|nr:hypothetical protein [Pelosinus propionicus]SFM09199.1 hypothetical protein SAMN04490355_104024 [Pelosinus propionicus DSM 13327]